MAELLLVDAKNAMWRAADTHSDLSVQMGSEKFPTGAVYGFLVILCRMYETFGGTVVVCWDDWKDGPAARRALFPYYKAQRAVASPVDPSTALPLDPREAERVRLVRDINRQMAPLMGILQVAGIRQTYSPGWEADDVMGTLAAVGRRAGAETVLVTGDRDLLQCVCPKVRVARPQPKGEFKLETPETVLAEWGVLPSQFVDLKALMGDTGDNIPGAKGIGKVGAAKLVTHFGDLGMMLSAAQSADPWPLAPSLRTKVLASMEDIDLSQQLARINCEAPIKQKPRQLDKQRLVKALLRLAFKSMFRNGRLEALCEMGSD